MEYGNVAKIVEVHGTDTNNVTRKVNAYLKYGWEIISIVQIGEAGDGSWSCASFILGHNSSVAPEPTIETYSKVWS